MRADLVVNLTLAWKERRDRAAAMLNGGGLFLGDYADVIDEMNHADAWTQYWAEQIGA